MAVTFTNKAAGEMRERINKLLGESVPTSSGWRGLTIGTFHSICARILRAEAAPAGLNPNFVIYDDGEQLTAIKQALRDLKLDEKMYRPEAMRGAISKAKNELVKPEAFEAGTYWAEVARRVYTRYQEIMAANGALDFDDLLTRTTWLLQEQPEVLRRYQERYEYLLVDEFQDTNTAQYELVRLLGGQTPQRLRRRRRRPVHLRLARRGLPQRDALPRGFSRGAGDPAGAELPLHPDDPRRGERDHRQEPVPHAQEAAHRPRRRPPGDRPRGVRRVG